jgi:hypothetical protein
MNALEIKAAELIEMATELGIKTEVQVQGDHLIYVRFGHTGITSRIIHTATGKANVKTWEHRGRRNELISLKALPGNLEWFASNRKRA